MVWVFRDNEEMVESEGLDVKKIKALNDPTRIEILKSLGEEPSYPAELSKKLDIPKQKTYYHFKKLEESGLIKEVDQMKKSGGLATIYEPVKPAMHLDVGGEGKKTSFKPMDAEIESFLEPLVKDGKLNGKIVVGSPDEHGPDQVRARDGHLAGEVSLKLGNYAKQGKKTVMLDTEIVRSESFDQNMLLIGGILTNTVARKFNEAFPARFEGESFPYRKLKTENNEYTDPKIGVIAKTENPESEGDYIYLVAGIRNKGTEAAVRAFKDLEHLFEEGQSYTVLRGKDMDGDGEIDEYEIMETG